MGRQLSQKRKAQIISLNSHRWKSHNSAKENLAPPLPPPRGTTTRAQNRTKELQDTVEIQHSRILQLRNSNQQLNTQISALATELEDTHSRIDTLELENASLNEELSDTHQQLTDAQELIIAQADLINKGNQRINRLIRDKSLLYAKIACLKQELAEAAISISESRQLSHSAALHVESLLQNITQLNSLLATQNARKADLTRELRAAEMREKRAKDAVARLREEVKAKRRWKVVQKHSYTSQYRGLVMAAHKAGCAQSRIGGLIARVGKMLGVSIPRSISRRTVGRVITEAGIKVRIQLGYELARAKAITLSSDGTSNRNIKYEARHATYKAPTYDPDPNAPQEAFVTRVVEVQHALDHTSDTQFQGWDIVNAKISSAYNNTSLARRDTSEGISYEEDDLWRKTVAYHSDHAPDVRLVAQKVKARKRMVLESDLGKEVMVQMTDSEIETALWGVLQEVSDDPDGLDPSSLDSSLRAEALKALVLTLGSTKLDSLPPDRAQLLTRMVIAGCCGHKDHNCTKYAVEGMQAVWEALGVPPPVLLANKDNAATIALGQDADSAAVEHALKVSARGGYKLVSICGDLFRHKDPKRGHQDFHRLYFSKVKFDATGEHSTVKFPDCSNIRYGSHLAGAAELLTYHSAYIDFLKIIRDTKTTPGLNHMEQNALTGLEDEATMCEIVVMTVYKCGISDPYMKAVRKPGLNHIDLGPLHIRLTEHVQKLIDDTDLLLSPLADSAEATFDGEPFSDQYAMDSVSFWLCKRPHRIPHVEALLIGALKRSLTGWGRFTTEWLPGGDIDSLTPAERVDMWIPTTNDPNESLLGGLRDYSRIRGGTVQHYNALEAYHRNNTEAFADAKLGTYDDAILIMRLARIEDASGANRKFRDELMAYKEKVAKEARERRAEKEAEAAAEHERLQSIVVITDVAKLQLLPVKKKGAANLREQLDVRRELWKDEVLVKTKLKDMSKKPDTLAAIIACDKRRAATNSVPNNSTS